MSKHWKEFLIAIVFAMLAALMVEYLPHSDKDVDIQFRLILKEPNQPPEPPTPPKAKKPGIVKAKPVKESPKSMDVQGQAPNPQCAGQQPQRGVTLLDEAKCEGHCLDQGQLTSPPDTGRACQADENGIDERHKGRGGLQ